MRHRYCSECGRSLAAATERRIARGEKALLHNAKTCSHRCAIARQRRYDEARRAKLRKRKMPPRKPGPWRCAECGISRGAADRKRKRLGLPPTDKRHVICSPRCVEARKRTWYLWHYDNPRPLKGRKHGPDGEWL